MLLSALFHYVNFRQIFNGIIIPITALNTIITDIQLYHHSFSWNSRGVSTNKSLTDSRSMPILENPDAPGQKLPLGRTIRLDIFLSLIL